MIILICIGWMAVLYHWWSQLWNHNPPVPSPIGGHLCNLRRKKNDWSFFPALRFLYQPLFFVGLYRTPVAQVAGILRRTAHRPSYFPSRTSVTIFLNNIIIIISTTLAIIANLDDLSQLVCLHWELVPLLAVEPAVHTGSHPRKDQLKGGFQKMRTKRFGMWKLPKHFNDLVNFLLQTRENLISIFDVFRPAKKMVVFE